MELLRLEHVASHAVAATGHEVPVLQDVSFEVHAGELLVLFGRSGGGKTTLLRLMNRLVEPAAGDLRYLGQRLDTYPPGELRRSIMLLPQRAVMFPGSVRENILLPLRMARRYEEMQDTSWFQTIMGQCQLAQELLERSASELSIGQQQRVALARALIARPTLMLADEPTSALDRPTARQIAMTLRDFAHSDGKASVMVSHDLELAATIADRMLFLDDGVVVEQGMPQKILKEPCDERLKEFLEHEAAEGKT